MPRGGLDPFFAPERIHVVTPPDGMTVAAASWTYPGVEQSETTVDGFDAASVRHDDLVVLAVGMDGLDGVLKTVSESDTEAILIPSYTERRPGPQDSRQRLDPDRVPLDQDSVPFNQDPMALKRDSVALEQDPVAQSRERVLSELDPVERSVPDGIRDAITNATPRVMGPGAGIQVAEPVGAAVQLPHEAGQVAVVGDDPVVASTIAERTAWQGSAVGAVVGVGAGIDVALGEVTGALGERQEIELVMGHTANVESRFVGDLRAADTGTPVAIQAAGGPAVQFGQTVVQGADVAAAMVEQAGAVPADSLERMVDGAPALAGQPAPDPASVVVVSNAGGPGVMAIDAVGASGLEVARMEEETIAALEAVVPEHGSARNPLDLLADSDIEVFETVLSTALEDPNVGSAVVISAPNPLFTFENLASIIAETTSRQEAPVVTALMGGEQTRSASGILRDAGIPNYFDPYRAVGALDLVAHHGAVVENRSREPAQPVGYEEGVSDRFEGGLDRQWEGEAAVAFVKALSGSTAVGPGGASDGLRMEVSAFRAPSHGPVLMLGVAEFVEAVGDVAVRAIPLSREDARSMLEGLQAAPLFGGARGQTAIATEPLLDLLQGVSHVLAARSAVREISFPGLRATGQGLQVSRVTVETGTRSTDTMPRG